MEVKVNAAGEVVLNVTNGDGQAAMDIIHALQADARKAQSQKIDPLKTPTGPLSKKQYEVWEYLCENDCEVGVSLNAMGREIGITDGAVGQRMQDLIKLGYARRVSTGRYRAEIPVEK